MLADRIMYFFSRPVVKTYTGTMLKMNVQKLEDLPPGAKIIAANHPSTTDPFFVASMVGHQSFILINEVLFQVPILGEYLRRSGHIPVQAGNGQAAIQTALERLSEGKTVIIFPEGALSPLGGGFQAARTGVARLALLSGAPVIPVGIHLNWKRIKIYRSVVRGREEYGRWYISGPYHQTVGAPLNYQGDVNDWEHTRKVADNVMQHIMELTRISRNRMDQMPTPMKPLLNPF